MQIGNHILKNNLVVAPMAGVTDRPFRQLCKKMGAGLAVSEMVTSNSLLYGSEKTRRRANHEGEVDPISVQIAGADPKMMAEAAKYNVDNGHGEPLYEQHCIIPVIINYRGFLYHRTIELLERFVPELI